MKKGFFTCLIAICGIAAGVSLSMKPWHVYAEQKKVTNEQVSEMKKLQAERIKDLQAEAHLSSSVGREELAREQGFHKVGEVPVNR